ncbi:MAG TPA: hypothetical protein VGW77_03560 [Candidatus Binatia bacterium]|nr:hypothetical protein [Candidatus Binatia bacterium]
MKTSITILAGLLFSVLLLVDGTIDAIASDATQAVAGGGVTVKVTYLNPKGSDGARFQIALDTHSVNLDSYDLNTISVLRDDAGNTYSPTVVENKGSGHHRETIVSFAKVASGTKRVELVIKDIAGMKERIFSWDLD